MSTIDTALRDLLAATRTAHAAALIDARAREAMSAAYDTYAQAALDAANATDDTADDILAAALADAMSAYDADRMEAS